MFDFLLNQSLDIVKTRTEVFSASRFLVKSLIFKTSNNTGTKSNIGIKLGIDTYHERCIMMSRIVTVILQARSQGRGGEKR